MLHVRGHKLHIEMCIFEPRFRLLALCRFIWDMRSFEKFLGNLLAFWDWLTFIPR